LLRRDERKALRGIPGISKIPVIRELFASNEKVVQEKDIIFTITPHILRMPNITEEDLAPIWIGTEDDIRLKSAPPMSVFERSKAEEGQALEGGVPPVPEADSKAPKPTPPESEESEEPDQKLEPKPEPTESTPRAAVVPKVVPESDLRQQEIKNGEGTTISFASPNLNPMVDSDIVLLVRLDQAAVAGSIYLYLNFDPTLLQVKDVLQGPFVTPGAFAKSFDNERGSININANHTAGEEQSGVVATVVFRSLKKGKTTINLNSAVVRDQESNVIPVTFLPYPIAIE